MGPLPWKYGKCSRHDSYEHAVVYVVGGEPFCTDCLLELVTEEAPGLIEEVQSQHRKNHPNLQMHTFLEGGRSNGCSRCDNEIFARWVWTTRVPSKVGGRD